MINFIIIIDGAWCFLAFLIHMSIRLYILRFNVEEDRSFISFSKKSMFAHCRNGQKNNVLMASSTAAIQKMLVPLTLITPPISSCIRLVILSGKADQGWGGGIGIRYLTPKTSPRDFGR